MNSIVKLMCLTSTAVALAACSAVDPGSNGDVSTATPTSVRVIDLPRPLVTPGTVLTTSARDVCVPGWAAVHRQDLSITDKRTVLSAYHLPSNTHPAEWDHLISLELGGGNGRLNVWPEMTSDGKKRKDKLENKLHRAVCRGDITVTDAQSEIVHFWQNW